MLPYEARRRPDVYSVSRRYTPSSNTPQATGDGSWLHVGAHPPSGIAGYPVAQLTLASLIKARNTSVALTHSAYAESLLINMLFGEFRLVFSSIGDPHHFSEWLRRRELGEKRCNGQGNCRQLLTCYEWLRASIGRGGNTSPHLHTWDAPLDVPFSRIEIPQLCSKWRQPAARVRVLVSVFLGPAKSQQSASSDD